MSHASSTHPQALVPSRIALVGYRGSGKSTVACRVAERLGWDWIDADYEVEKRAGMAIAEIFARQGEAAFRDLEAKVLADLLQRDGVVVATGGGAVLRTDNRQRLRSAWVVWLTASPSTLFDRMAQDASTATRRPGLTALGGREEVGQVLAARSAAYSEVADCQVSTEARTPEQIADDIVSKWRATGGHGARED